MNYEQDKKLTAEQCRQICVKFKEAGMHGLAAMWLNTAIARSSTFQQEKNLSISRAAYSESKPELKQVTEFAHEKEHPTEPGLALWDFFHEGHHSQALVAAHHLGEAQAHLPGDHLEWSLQDVYVINKPGLITEQGLD